MLCLISMLGSRLWWCWCVAAVSLLPRLVAAEGPVDAPIDRVSDTPPPSTPIMGGDPTATGEFDEVVAITIGDELCTGTVVAPRLVLTAAHCLVDTTDATRVFVHYGKDVFGGRIEASSWGTHPDYCHECRNDIFDYGYVLLPANFSVPGGFPAPITDQDEWDDYMTAGTPLTLVGYGGDHETEDMVYNAGRKRSVDTTLRKLTPKGTEFTAGGSGEDTCPGDSGGPAFVVLPDGTRRLAGITSRGGKPCGKGGYYGTPYPALCWVRDVTGVDLIGPECGACDCLDIAPPAENDRCAVAPSDDAPGWLGWLAIAVIVVRTGAAARRATGRDRANG